MAGRTRVSIPESELNFSFSRAGGPGGQNVNKVETKVTLSFDYAASRVLSREQKERIRASKVIQNRTDSSGAIVVVSQAYRTQASNRMAAVERLYELLEVALHRPRIRVPTKKSRASERRRLDRKRALGDKKAGRSRSTRHED